MTNPDVTAELVAALADAADVAYSEMAFAVHDLAGRRLSSEEATDNRASRLAKAADEIQSALSAYRASQPVSAPGEGGEPDFNKIRLLVERAMGATGFPFSQNDGATFAEKFVDAVGRNARAWRKALSPSSAERTCCARALERAAEVAGEVDEDGWNVWPDGDEIAAAIRALRKDAQ